MAMRSGSSPWPPLPRSGSGTPSYSPKRSGSSGCSSSTTTATLTRARASSGGSRSSAFRTCCSNEATSVRRSQWLPLPEEEHGEHAEERTADVGEDGDAPLLRRMLELEVGLVELEREVD